jgi:hypothetical protein
MNTNIIKTITSILIITVLLFSFTAHIGAAYIAPPSSETPPPIPTAELKEDEEEETTEYAVVMIGVKIYIVITTTTTSGSVERHVIPVKGITRAKNLDALK